MQNLNFLDIQSVISQTAEATAKALEKRLAPKRVAPSEQPPFLSVHEACEYLACSRATLRRLEEAGVLIPKRFGRRVLYERSAVELYIANAAPR